MRSTNRIKAPVTVAHHGRHDRKDNDNSRSRSRSRD
jgi:hypothetical protein